jgi:hypothetical protein
MELGTGIFLSAVFLGTVALFIATKDRWNWKKIFLWPLAIIVGIGIVGGIIVYLYDAYEDRPTKITELWGISLSDSPADVKFKKGEPKERIDQDIWIYRPYETIEGNYVVYFKNDRVRSVIYFGAMYNAPTLKGFSHYDTPQDVETKLGPPFHISRTKDELRRAYSFDNFNVVVHFAHGEMSAIGIYDPNAGAFKFKEEPDETANSN